MLPFKIRQKPGHARLVDRIRPER